MNTNDLRNTGCERETLLIAYLYGEASPPERVEFESHLLECTACTDEFAAMSNARYSVYEWQREEFAPLATPEFSIPYESKSAMSWAQTVRSMLSFQWPAYAVAAVLIVALCGIGIWNLRQISNHSGAGLDIEADQHEKPSNSAPSRASSTRDEDTETDIARNTDRSKLPPKTSVVKVADGSSRHVPKARRAADPIRNVVRSAEVASTIKSRRPLPTLTASVEEEDGSLRLSDLFESVDR
jgi:Putative zinc-finger